jgi:Nucleotidyl transferase AbiEii toxin, Type IV TA system
MPKHFQPRLDILPAAPRRLWPDLIDVPGYFALYGGTAIALRLAHRQSVDFDFFGRQQFDPDALYRQLACLRGAEVLQKTGDTLTCLAQRQGPVRVSFFALPDFPEIGEPDVAPDIGLRIASLIDLAGTKAAVVQARAEAKDYIDLDALMAHGIDLPHALAAGQALYGTGFNPQITLKALTYFADGTLPSLAEDTRHRLVDAVAKASLDRLPILAVKRPRGGKAAP